MTERPAAQRFADYVERLLAAVGDEKVFRPSRGCRRAEMLDEVLPSTGRNVWMAEVQDVGCFAA